MVHIRFSSGTCPDWDGWMPQENPRLSNLKDVITSFGEQFRIHVRTKHPHLREQKALPSSSDGRAKPVNLTSSEHHILDGNHRTGQN
jgi:hypothetical protein